MNRFFLILIFGLLSVLGIQARETIKGMVTDSQGAPLPGVKVEVPGTSQYVFTDLDGAFQIILRDPVKKLNFSYPGLGTTSQSVHPEMTVTLGKGWAGREKGYRGMFDIEGGMGVNGKVTLKYSVNELRDIHTFCTFGFTTTHGYQINKHLFVGLGFGAYIDYLKFHELSVSTSVQESNTYELWRQLPISGLHIPVYISARWDFGLSQKTAPYVGLRVGYASFIADDEDEISNISSYFGSGRGSRMIVTQANCSYPYLMPTIGYHVNLRNKLGMNLGLSYLMGRKSKFSVIGAYDTYNSDGEWYQITSSDKFTQRASEMLIFNIGFDF